MRRRFLCEAMAFGTRVVQLELCDTMGNRRLIVPGLVMLASHPALKQENETAQIQPVNQRDKSGTGFATY